MALKCSIVPVTPFVQNCSIIMCEETGAAAVVDPGGDIDRVVAAIEQMGAKPEKIWLTHGHLDHCSGADDLRQRLGIPIEGPHIEDKFWIDQLPEQSARMGMSADAFEPDRWLEDNDTVEIAGHTFEVRHCPGHTPGHVVFHNKDQQVAFVGDVLFKGSIGRTDFPRGDHATLINAIETKLWPMGDNVMFVSGHGETSTFGEERMTNPFVADARYR